MNQQTYTISREALYEEVWRTPISKLAAAWGVTSSSITKACDQMNVPRPVSGHWRWVALGWQVDCEPLPAADASLPDQAVLKPTSNRAWIDVTKPIEASSNPPASDVGSHLANDPVPAQSSTDLSVSLTADVGLGNALDAFDKLETAYRLIREALAERPSLQVVELDPLLNALTEGMQILALKDSELDLPMLMMKHEWSIGQRFYVRARVGDDSHTAFVVLPAQDIPEGVVICAQSPRLGLCKGQVVGLNLDLRRKHLKAAWHIRAIDL